MDDARYTTLVVGAGASVSFGLPVGSQLNEALWERCIRSAVGHLQNLTSKQEEINTLEATSFARELSRSGQASIDAFLAAQDKHPHFKFRQTVAKIAISLALSSLERRALALPYVGWINNVFQNLQRADPFLNDHKLRIITFNYDRLIEFMLAGMLVNSRSINPSAAVASVEKFVVHLYGRLPGQMEWDGSAKHFALRGGGATINGHEPHHGDASNTLFTIGEERGGHREEVSLAHTWLKNSKTIIFLGFGFADENLQLLSFEPKEARDGNSPWWHLVNFASTGFGYSDEVRRVIEQKFGRANRSPKQWTWGAPSDTCDSFLSQKFFLNL